MSSSETGSVVTRVYDAASRMVSSSDGSTYTFDANGNLTAIDDIKSELEYDKENRLIFYSSDSNPGVDTTMVYNAFGQKKRETNPDSDTLFTWDGDDYYGFADAANDPENAVKIFIGDRGTMLGEFNPADSQSRMDYMVDFLGSVTGQTNKKGDLGSERRFKPFGELLSGDPVKPLDFAWTGNTGSMHTGLLYSEQYNRARHYSTTTNIWTIRDPLWPSEHAYGYVGGNPIAKIDPNGQVVVVVIAIGIGIGGLISVSTSPDKAKQFMDEMFCCRAQADLATKASSSWCNKHFNVKAPKDGTLCNAYQHCMWACLTAQRCGIHAAKMCTDAHEPNPPFGLTYCPPYRQVPQNGQPNPPRHKCMDLYNNAIGISCSSASSCDTCCTINAKTGSFEVVEPMKPMPRNWRVPRTNCKRKYGH